MLHEFGLPSEGRDAISGTCIALEVVMELARTMQFQSTVETFWIDPVGGNGRARWPESEL